jgi:hypothetical protein
MLWLCGEMSGVSPLLSLSSNVASRLALNDDETYFAIKFLRSMILKISQLAPAQGSLSFTCHPPQSGSSSFYPAS